MTEDRPKETWRLRGGLALSAEFVAENAQKASQELFPYCLMGIVNATADSFYDGGRYAPSCQNEGQACPKQEQEENLNKAALIKREALFDYNNAAIKQALRLYDEGALIVDIGGESTRPHATEVSAKEEWQRIEPVIKGVLKARPKALVSVDTKKASVAEKALLAGAHCINDVSACLYEPALLEIVADKKPGYVLMHNTGPASNLLEAEKANNLESYLLHFFEEQLSRLVKAGLPEEHIMLDPGIGFGTNTALALEMLRLTPRLRQFGRPLLLGLSMKSFLGDFFGASLHERGPWTNLATALFATKGIYWHRVHDVKNCAKALSFVREMNKA